MAGRELSEDAPAGGNSPQMVDTFAWTVLGVICGLGVVLYFGQKLQATLLKKPPKLSRVGIPRTPNWVLASFAGCYALLIPGLFSTLFAYKLGAMGGSVELRHATESMVTFVRLLFEEDCYSGAVLVVLAAMVIPAVKLVLLVLSEVWRRGSPQQVMRARHTVHAMQFISKWACPDMFAYVLLLYLLRHLNMPPTVVAVAEMDIGFTCFAVFCVGSTVAALGLKLPPVPEGMEEKSPCCSLVANYPGLVAGVVALMCTAFVPLLIIGLSVPSMSLRLNTDAMYEPSGPLDPMLKPMVDMLNLDQLAKADVSIIHCMQKLAEWTRQGEANSFIAFFLFAICVITTTCLDMLTLLVTSVLLWYKAAHPTAARTISSNSNSEQPMLLIRVIKVLKKLSFLDVAITGVLVVVVCGQAYRSQGIVLFMDTGLLYLLGAEVCHYIAYYLLMHAAEPEAMGPATSGQKSGLQEDLESSSSSDTPPLPKLLGSSIPASAQDAKAKSTEQLEQGADSEQPAPSVRSREAPNAEVAAADGGSGGDIISHV